MASLLKAAGGGGVNKHRKVTIRSGNLGGSKAGRGRMCEILFGNGKGTQSRDGSIGVLGHEHHRGICGCIVSWAMDQRWGICGCIACWAMSSAGEPADAWHAGPWTNAGESVDASRAGA